MKQKIPNKRYIVKKYIMAKSIKEALKKERRTIPDDCWVDEDWRKDNPNKLESAMGFLADSDRDYYDLYLNKKKK